VSNSETAEDQLVKYIELINRDDFDVNDHFDVYSHPDFEKLWPLFNRLVRTSYICRRGTRILLKRHHNEASSRKNVGRVARNTDVS
jgi:hypothetical protein